MKRYFSGCHTAEDLKQEYKKAARKLHPDCNPGVDTTAEFQRMQAEFEEAWEKLKNIHASSEKENDYTYTKTESNFSAKNYMQIINRIINIPGIEIEICGTWIGITGNTYPVKDAISEAGFYYSRNKRAWYWHEEGYKRTGKKRYTMDEIRSMHGSERVKGVRPEVLLA